MASSSSQVDGGVKLEEQKQVQQEQTEQPPSPRLAKRGTKRISKWPLHVWNERRFRYMLAEPALQPFSFAANHRHVFLCRDTIASAS